MEARNGGAEETTPTDVRPTGEARFSGSIPFMSSLQIQIRTEKATAIMADGKRTAMSSSSCRRFFRLLYHSPYVSSVPVSGVRQEKAAKKRRQHHRKKPPFPLSFIFLAFFALLSSSFFPSISQTLTLRTPRPSPLSPSSYPPPSPSRRSPPPPSPSRRAPPPPPPSRRPPPPPSGRAPPPPSPSPHPPPPPPPPSASSDCSNVSELTEGPYWVEENILASNVRQNLTFGVPLNLTFKVNNATATAASLSTDCVPVEGARVDIWQARYDGKYSDIEDENTEGQTWLRGYQITNSSGYASFITIYPGWYTSRTVHVHLRIRAYDSDQTLLYNDTTQLFFNDTISSEVFSNVYPYNSRTGLRDTYNSQDSLFTSNNLISLTGNYTNGYSSSPIELNIPLSSSSLIRSIPDDDQEHPT